MEWIKKKWFYHSFIWLLGFVFLVLIGVIVGDDSYNEILKELLPFYLPFIPIVYLNFYWKNKLFKHRLYVKYGISVIITISIGVGIYQTLGYLMSDLHQHPVQDASNTFFALAISTGLQYFKRGIVSQYQLQELRAKTVQMELNALKAQINPHFLFNTLNNIYATNQIDSIKGSEMIMELAEVMRYHLSFSKSKTVPLSDEIQLIKSYIELEKLRLRDNLDFVEHFPEDHQLINKFIEPLILLPFIENAFKHGTHSTAPCFININLKIGDNNMVLEIKNSVIKNKKKVVTNLGIANIKRRLSIIYPDRHKLIINETDSEFNLKLALAL